MESLNYSRTTSNTSEGIGSDSLRKAIERNRAKMTKRKKSPPSSPAGMSDMTQETMNFNPGSSKTPSMIFGNSGNRKRVASASQIELVEPLREMRRKPPAKVSYLSVDAKTKKKIKKSIKGNVFVYLGWLFNFFLLIRLVFASNGMIDYYAKEQELAKLEMKWQRIKEDNIIVAAEIEKIRTDRIYQKKIAREHLGVIASDEYLVLLAD